MVGASPEPSAATRQVRAQAVLPAGAHGFLEMLRHVPGLGLVVVLSLGYGGAEGALVKMAKNYGVQIRDHALQFAG